MSIFRRRVEGILPKNFRDAPLEIVADAVMLQQGVGEGRFIPLVILDTSKRTDIDDLILVHEVSPPGDAQTQWIQLLGPYSGVGLIIKFLRPSETIFVVRFDITRIATVVDQAIYSRAIYLQGGKIGDRLVNSMNTPRILIEIGAGGFEVAWEKIWLKELRTKFREKGASRGDSKSLAKAFISTFRQTLRREIKG